MSELNLDIPADFRLLHKDGTPASYSELTDSQIQELCAAFYELLVSLRDRARLH